MSVYPAFLSDFTISRWRKLNVTCFCAAGFYPVAGLLATADTVLLQMLASQVLLCSFFELMMSLLLITSLLFLASLLLPGSLLQDSQLLQTSYTVAAAEVLYWE